ncbi:PREDICTED: uncharacterized protein LOC100638129 [Amphimedon queenslandica]|uniref:RGS domain-containing protein n=1 Tax=Amphimedon queenslandica TaxID=400682 RepID=A0A1X7V2Z2_AMPQE|nr:PREDICTED: uncharacterized protein LOC100638129 [Amphimedon queenslandica]|eukprot:XP_019850801.1 PREDICTED: uncharacterized protein LOC100638129 [Amphimedon queenslandica]
MLLTGRGCSVLNGLSRWRCEEEGTRPGEGFTLSRTTTESFYHTMSLKLLMSTDQLLKEVFADYLKLPIFPVNLEYHMSHGNTGRLVDPSKANLDVWSSSIVQHNLFEWVESHRLPYFIKSEKYAELNFCRQLMKRRSITISYSQFKCFRSKLFNTKGGLHLELWLKLSQLFPPCFSDGTIVDHFDFKKLSITLRQYSSVMTELKMPLFPMYCGPLSKIKWVEYVLSQLLQRLADYWWLRSASYLCPSNHCTHERSLNASDVDFVGLTLLLENKVGYPFLDHLHREAADTEVIQYHVWEDIGHVLEQETHFELKKRSISACLGKYSSEVVKKLGLSSLLELKPDDDINKSLTDIRDKMMFSLRRKWTTYMHNDYESYCRCFPPRVQWKLLPQSMFPSPDPLLDNDDNEPNSSSPCHNKKQFVSRNISRGRRFICRPEVTLSMSDLGGTPLGAFPTPQAVEDFKSYLEDSYGAGSQEIVSFEVWLAILLHQKVPKGCKNYHAKKIYRDFLSPHSKVPLTLPKTLKKPLPRRPPSPVLRELQSSSFESFSDDLVDFLRILNSSVQSSRPTPDMILMHSFLEEDCMSFKELNHVEKKLYHFLENNIKEKTKKLKAFERFLLERGPMDCPALLFNSAQYWMEIHIFQSVVSGSDLYFLSKKFVALANRFLDTSSPPWVKIAISNDLATTLTDAALSFAESPNEEKFEALKELVSRSKATVFSHLVQFWVEFNEFYKSLPSSPSHSFLSTTCSIKARNSSSSSNDVLHPPTPPDNKTPAVLSYSRQDGLQWITLAAQIAAAETQA